MTFDWVLDFHLIQSDGISLISNIMMILLRLFLVLTLIEIIVIINKRNHNYLNFVDLI